MSASAINNGAGGNGDNNQDASITNGSGGTSKANFQSYETQCRLLAALVASLEEKGIKLDYKLIAQYLGGGKSASSLEHHFRGVRLRAQVARGVGDDPYRISDSEFLGMGDGMLGQRKAKEIIHRYFKASTPGGIEFKFREVRKTAQEMRAADAAGTTTTATPSGTASAPVTPRKRAAPASTPRKRAPASSTAGARKKAKQTMMAEDEDEDDSEYKEKSARARPTSRGGRRGSSAATATATITPATTVRPSPTPSAATSSFQLFAPGWAPDSPASVSRQLSLSETIDDVKRETEGGQDLSYFTQQQQVQRDREFQAGLQRQNQNVMQQFAYNPEQERLQLQNFQQQQQHYDLHHEQQFSYLPPTQIQTQPHSYAAPSTGFPSQSQSQSPAHAPSRFTEEDDFSNHGDQHQHQRYQGSFTEQLYEEDGEI